MLYLRSHLFDLFLYSFSAIFLLLFLPFMVILPRGFCSWMFRVWSTIILTALKYIVGLKYEVRGYEHYQAARANGPVIIACKHQSAFETIVPSLLFDQFVIVLKKQLMYIPVFGLYLRKLSSISLDRAKGASAIKKMLRDGKKALEQGQDIFIFPEGTRGMAGEPGIYQPGIIALYGLNVPVIPVALNSGQFWGRRSPLKKPGTIVIEFLEAIPPKLDRKEFMTTLERSIETKSLEIFHEQQQN